MAWEKVACWSTKAAISLKGVNKIEEKLLWRAYRNSPTLFRTVPSRPPIRPPLPQDWGSQPPPKTSVAIISGKGKAIYRLQIWAVHSQSIRTKAPLKIVEKRERMRNCVSIRDCPFLKKKYLLLSQEPVKVRTSNFVLTFIRSIGTKAR